MTWLRFALPLLLVALAELAFRVGTWEPVAKPESSAGQSIQLKRAVLRHPAHVDVVTLGNSRAVYGLDHEGLAAAAREKGLAHVNLALPGSHWMSIKSLSDWIRKQHPEVRARLIAVSVTDFVYAGNGAYELGIVQPFRRWGDTEWVQNHVRFSSASLPTYAVYSSLFGYREDVQDLVRSPGGRWGSVRWWHEHGRNLFEGPKVEKDSCRVDTSSLQSCVATAPGSLTADDRIVVQQCKGLTGGAKYRVDLAPFLEEKSEPPAEVAAGRSVVRSYLSERAWKGRTLVVLMPTHHIWLDEVSARAVHAWALQTLAPLVAAGDIDLLDYTDLFNSRGGSDCRAFWDLYHQNASGRERLAALLLPAVRERLYRVGAQSASD
jgi:hypothetical protein